ncbi:MAG: class D sortase [Dehalococcoidia bacterium]|nr:class D sortase [Dehalococcoidia bacterium]
MERQRVIGSKSTSTRLVGVISSLLMISGAALTAVSFLYVVYSGQAQVQLKNIEATQSNVSEPAFMLPVPQYPNLLPNTAPDVQWISIPSIDVDSATVELGTKLDNNGALVWETPDHAVGHHRGTANPGETGNVVMSGHISSPVRGEGNVFRRLPEITVGDDVLVTTPLGQFHYQVVQKKIVLPDEVSVMDPTPEPVLTLITCVPDLVYSHRLVVISRPVRVAPL